MGGRQGQRLSKSSITHSLLSYDIPFVTYSRLNYKSWFTTLPSQITTAGFEQSDVHKHPLKPEHYKAWTEDYLLVYEEVADMLPKSADAPPGTPMTREMYHGLFAKVVEECEAGAVMHSGHLLVAVGMKVGDGV